MNIILLLNCCYSIGKFLHFRKINIRCSSRVVNPILLAVFIFTGCQQKAPTAVSTHFISTKKDLIGLVVKDKNLQITSAQFKGFVQCKPYLAWRSQGIKIWTGDFSESIESAQISDKETKLTCLVGPVVATILVKQLDENMLEFSGSIRNKSAQTIEMARFHYLQGTVENEKSSFIGNIPESFRLIRKTDSLPAPRLAFEKLWKSMGPDYPMLSNPIHDDANWAVSKDLGIFAEAFNQPGWLMAFTGPGTAYGEIGFRTLENPSSFFAGVLLDNIILEPDSSRILEKFIIHSGDWQEGMASWVKLTADEFKVKPEPKPLVGYCSWYQEGNNITTKSILKANKDVANWPIPDGGRTVQIDGGWAIGAGDWQPNEKFDSFWSNLPKQIAETGSIPGLWLAPTAIHDGHKMIKEHPEMLQKFEKGIAPIHFPGLGYFMENDRPDCKEFVGNFMKAKVAEGWRYFKIDFTYPLSTARIAYNRKKTQFESHRDLYKLLRKSVGPEVLLNSCIGCMDRYPIGSVNIDRISGDIGSDWKMVQGNLRDILSRACTNGYWWQADADVFYMRSENTSLTKDENFLLTGSIGMIGGAFLTSDYPSQWDAEAKKVVGEFWTNEGPRVPYRHFVLYDDQNNIKAYLVSYNDGKKPDHRLGIYNWGNVKQNMKISISDLHLNTSLNWNASSLFDNQKVQFSSGEVLVASQPAHSLRIVNLDAK